MSAILYGSNSPKDVILGIDNFTFQLSAGQPFGGIKHIPSGIHVVHWGDDTIRYGYWFDTESHHRIVYNGSFELVSVDGSHGYEQELASHFQFMVSYPNECEWSQLSQYTSLEQAQSITGNTKAYVDSSMTSVEESQLLETKLSGGPTITPAKDPVFHYRTIKFKSLEAIRQDHKQEDFLDKSYYLNQVLLPQHYGNHFDRLLGELQFAFLNTMVFGNYGSSLQWHTIIELVSCSSRVSRDTMKRFDKLISLQLENLQQEYLDYLLNASVWSRVLNDSYQAETLFLTRRTLSNRVPDLLEATEQDDSDEDDDSDYNGDGQSRSSDEFSPTVVGGVYYYRH